MTTHLNAATASSNGKTELAPFVAPAPASAWTGFSRLTWMSLYKVLTNPYNLGFSLALPIVIYLMFGVGKEYSSIWVGHGNVASSILASMALYGVMLTSSSLGANVSLERSNGVSRLFALTPISTVAQIVARLTAAFFLSAVTILITYSIGYATGSRMEPLVWLMTGALIVVASTMATAIGLAAGFAVRTDGAFAASSMVILIGAFLSGMFLPLDQMGSFFQTIAPYAPLYGPLQLVMSPIYGAEIKAWWIVSLVAWMLFFVAIAVWGQRRDTAR